MTAAFMAAGAPSSKLHAAGNDAYTVKPDDISYTVRIKKSYDAVIDDLKDSIMDHNYKIVNVSDIQKGISGRTGAPPIGKYKIYEFCNLSLAEKLLTKDLRFGVLMPCRANIYEDRGEVVIMTMRPTFVVKTFGDPSLMGLAEQVEKEMKEIIDAVK